MSNLPARYWINAPSTLQPAHRYHGMLGLAVHDSGNMARFYPIAGDVLDMRLSWSELSPGWPEHLRIENRPERAKLYERTPQPVREQQDDSATPPSSSSE